MSVQRYQIAIEAMLEIEQKKSEISELTRVVKNNLTVSEYVNDSPNINKIHLKLAFSKLTDGQINLVVENRYKENFNGPVILKCNHVTSQIIYKDVSISLHANVLINPREALMQIISEHK